MWHLIESAISLLTGEWLLRTRPNGGAVILVRALLISALLFLVGIGIVERLAPGSSWALDPGRLLLAIGGHLGWLSALFAGSYAALYARFASQWTYLAGLYNQIMSAQATSPKDGNAERCRVYNNWKAAFIEDAENVHLALKPLYAALIKDMLTDSEVRKAFIDNAVGGAERLEGLEKAVSWAVAREEALWQKRAAKRNKRKSLPEGEANVRPPPLGPAADNAVTQQSESAI